MIRLAVEQENMGDGMGLTQLKVGTIMIVNSTGHKIVEPFCGSNKVSSNLRMTAILRLSKQ